MGRGEERRSDSRVNAWQMSMWLKSGTTSDSGSISDLISWMFELKTGTIQPSLEFAASSDLTITEIIVSVSIREKDSERQGKEGEGEAVWRVSHAGHNREFTLIKSHLPRLHDR